MKKKAVAKVTCNKEQKNVRVSIPAWMQPGSTRDLPWRMQKKKTKKSD